MLVISLRDQTQATGPHRIVILTQVIAQDAQVVILMRVISRRDQTQVIDQPLTVTLILPLPLTMIGRLIRRDAR